MAAISNFKDNFDLEYSFQQKCGDSCIYSLSCSLQRAQKKRASSTLATCSLQLQAYQANKKKQQQQQCPADSWHLKPFNSSSSSKSTISTLRKSVHSRQLGKSSQSLAVSFSSKSISTAPSWEETHNKLYQAASPDQWRRAGQQLVHTHRHTTAVSCCSSPLCSKRRRGPASSGSSSSSETASSEGKRKEKTIEAKWENSPATCLQFKSSHSGS